MGAQSSAVIIQNIYSDSLHILAPGTDKASYLEQQAHQLPCAAALPMPTPQPCPVTLHLWAVS